MHVFMLKTVAILTPLLLPNTALTSREFSQVSSTVRYSSMSWGRVILDHRPGTPTAPQSGSPLCIFGTVLCPKLAHKGLIDS